MCVSSYPPQTRRTPSAIRCPNFIQPCSVFLRRWMCSRFLPLSSSVVAPARRVPSSDKSMACRFASRILPILEAALSSNSLSSLRRRFLRIKKKRRDDATHTSAHLRQGLPMQGVQPLGLGAASHCISEGFESNHRSGVAFGGNTKTSSKRRFRGSPCKK